MEEDKDNQELKETDKATRIENLKSVNVNFNIFIKQ